MSDTSLDLYSAGVILYCTSNQKWGNISVVEQTLSANNYRGELLEAVILQYIIWAATLDLPLTDLSTTLFCDNQGVMSHGNLMSTSLPKEQPSPI
jgi:hypothetical protein